MNILHTVELYIPSKCGMQEVVQQISERLVQRGHSVTVATSYHPKRNRSVINGVHIKQFHIQGNDVRGIVGKKEEIERYINLLCSSKFDIVTNFAAQQWATDLALSILNKIKAKKMFVPTGFSGLYYPQYKEYFMKMKQWMKQYDMNVFLSNDYRDSDFAKKNGVKKRIVIPNGASEEEFLSKNSIDIRKKLHIPSNHSLILHVGSHTGSKGHRELLKIFVKAKISNATLLIIGHKTTNRCTNACMLKSIAYNLSPKRLFDTNKILLESMNRSETVSAYHQADVFLFPSNIECSPIVLFEAMASKTPFLSTNVGNAKEIITWSNSGILLPTTTDTNGYSFADIDTSAHMLKHILASPDKRRIMAKNGYNAWKKRLTWDRIVQQYEELYKNVNE